MQKIFLCSVLGLAMAFAASADDKKGRMKGMDKNNDRTISREEWRGNNKSFGRHDRNNDGVINRSDKKDHKGLTGHHRKLDTNNDGIISRSEWTDKGKKFDKLDANHDGQISRDEVGRRHNRRHK